MKKIIYLLVIAFLSSINLYAVETKADTAVFNKSEVIITAPRMDVQLKYYPAAASIVDQDALKTMPRAIGSEEALMFVPGVRVDNQANGERVHMSIRGQGILTERGLRGIKVLIDGVPVNDPTGFAPDLFDVDWSLVDKIEVLRGPSASTYGGSGAAGVLNITTKSGEAGGLGGFNKDVSFEAGSNAFIKGLVSADGKSENMDYRLSFSKMQGNGYRDHTGFWANNFSEKINWAASDKVKITQVFMATDFFNQNAEGLSLDQVNQNPKQANGDAIPFNEYQRTDRITNGISGSIKISDMQDIQFNSFLRWWNYKETSNKAADYREFTNPGGGVQYNLHLGNENLRHNFGAGLEFQWQTIGEVKFPSANDTTRKDSQFDEGNIELPSLLANQSIKQSLFGAYAFYNLELNKKLNVTANVRYDNIHNQLNDKLNLVDTIMLSGKADFDKVTGKIGASYAFSDEFSLFANWGTGFIPPATEELANNPYSNGGFNPDLKPATSISEELGFRGFINNMVYYDITGFYMTTDKDYFRFKIYEPTPKYPRAGGNQEVFYGNIGETKRFGLETFFDIKPIDKMDIQIAYTYSHFTYTTPDSIKDNWLPNSPEHILNLDVSYEILRNVTVGVGIEMQSKWHIFVGVEPLDSGSVITSASGKLSDIVQDGFTLLNARIMYNWHCCGLDGTIGVYGRNLGDTKWVAFTEPDPGMNCYQPGAGREFFGMLRIKF
jgi:iron complex outermembrane receptor protein